MKNIIIENGRIYFTVGKKRYALTPIEEDFMVEEARGVFLISNERSESIEKQFRRIK